MPDYETMYYLMYNAVTEAIVLLQEAQAKAEELFIEGEEPPEHNPFLSGKE